MGMLEQRDERQQTSVPCNTKGERELLSAPPPKVAEELPAALRAQERIAFDVASYDLRGEAAKLLEDAGLKVGFGSFDGHSRELEDFAAAEAVFSSFKYERHWRQCVREAEAFLQVYERLVREVICPVLKSKLEEEGCSHCYWHARFSLQTHILYSQNSDGLTRVAGDLWFVF
eukprot:TRINITY_DN5570_c0_g1_i9.p1 TRINITY_DN5570_c0_g1~~TRINITY_DN5570_c0_g1_i9.p1  ORF type:complete len:173 (-),score=37.50 TRINITY_DN5570_c0_g1_i9:74-592(-)